MVDFVKQGTPTPEGAQVLAHLNSLIEAAGRDVDALNALAGHVKYFYVNVKRLGALSEAEFLRDYPNMAGAAYRDALQLAEALAQADADKSEKTAMSESIELLKTQLADALDRLAKLEAEPDGADETPKSDTPVETERPAKKAKAEPEGETEA